MLNHLPSESPECLRKLDRPGSHPSGIIIAGNIRLDPDSSKSLLEDIESCGELLASSYHLGLLLGYNFLGLGELCWASC